MIIAAVNFGGVNIFTACFYWFLTGGIAGTVAHFIVRGKMGCFFGNFFLGIVGAIIADFILNLFFKNQSLSLNFIEITVAASIFATLIALIFHEARRAETGYQQRLLDRKP